VPTVLLLGHNTASAAEDFLILADNQKHMTKIGAHSFGSTGQPYLFDLPGGGLARVCTKKDTYPDGREFVGYGIKPDIEVKQTLDDYIQKRDPVLQKALEYLKTKKK
jgi:C-terminal processing protease CtpA/Prc